MRGRGRGRGSGSGTPNATRLNGDVVVPERISVPAIRFPSEVNAGDLGDVGFCLELGGGGIRNTWVDSKTRDRVAVQPGLDSAIGAQVILEALEGTGRKWDRLGGALRRHVGHGSVVGLAIIHQNLILAAKAKILASALGRVRHGEEGNVVGGQSRCGLAVRNGASVSHIFNKPYIRQ